MKSTSSIALVVVVVGGAVAAVWAVRSSDAERGGAIPTTSASSVASTTAAAPHVSAKAGAPPWFAIPSATAALLPNMGINERFEIEGRSRPANAKPHAEDVFAAIEKAGVKLVEKKQHLGSVFGARYCMGARAVESGDAGDPTMVHISACEYIDAETAKISGDYSQEALKSLGNRSVFANKQTTLTVREEKTSPENDAVLAKIIDTFKSL